MKMQMKIVFCAVVASGLVTGVAWSAEGGNDAQKERHEKALEPHENLVDAPVVPDKDDHVQGHNPYPSFEVLPVYRPVSPEQVCSAQDSTQRVQDLPDAELNHLASSYVAPFAQGLVYDAKQDALARRAFYTQITRMLDQWYEDTRRNAQTEREKDGK